MNWSSSSSSPLWFELNVATIFVTVNRVHLHESHVCRGRPYLADCHTRVRLQSPWSYLLPAARRGGRPCS
jgi:hypothetical protein